MALLSPGCACAAGTAVAKPAARAMTTTVLRPRTGMRGYEDDRMGPAFWRCGPGKGVAGGRGGSGETAAGARPCPNRG
ncbi:hypothetical protein [Streptomyces yatensis]|uniref:hypothetical protein n=1 Tax=Streptomyces yatensis TaxID=155177 RepID=UPI003CCEF7E0